MKVTELNEKNHEMENFVREALKVLLLGNLKPQRTQRTTEEI
jgi:hypothetical protein